MKIIILHFAVFFGFYIIGAYATTDILRLLKGSDLPINEPDCYCPVCHKRIALRDQLPVLSYLKNHGRCKNCESPIPTSDLFLEVFLFTLLSCIAAVFHFSWTGFGLCVIFYESVKIIFLLRFGKREHAFWKNLFLSFINNLFLFGILASFFGLEHLL